MKNEWDFISVCGYPSNLYALYGCHYWLMISEKRRNQMKRRVCNALGYKSNYWGNL